MNDQRSLFDAPLATCGATRELVLQYGYCPLCADGPDKHDPWTPARYLSAGDGFDVFVCSLPRVLA